MILVDTSVWVDHLRTGDQGLADLLDSSMVLVHPFVVGELALGQLRQRGRILGLLKTLPQITEPHMVSRSKGKKTPQLRSFRSTDLPKCYEIVALSFGMSERISPHILADFLAKLYVESSVIESSKAFGLEVDGEVVGFLFGCLPDEPLLQGRYSGFFGKLAMIGEMLFLNGVSLVSKWTWLKNAIEHDRRSPDLGTNCEVTLFAISPAAQGLGGGRILLEAFIDHCVANGQSDLYLESDASSNFRFYEHLGFKHIDSFNSPLAAAFSGGSGETFVYHKALSS